MYVLTHEGRVLAGPMAWNRAIFGGNLEKLGINFLLPRNAPEQLPLAIDANTVIYEVEFQEPEFDNKTHYKEGPYWQFTETKAIATYVLKEQPLSVVKDSLKQSAAAERWKKEGAGVKTVIQDMQVTVDTARGNRDIFVQKYLLMADTDTVKWKFPEGWLTLTKAELGQIVAAGAAHVQSSFDWEEEKVQEINAASTLEALKAVVIVDPAQDPRQRGRLARRMMNKTPE